MLRAAGHTAVIPSDAGLTGMSDDLHLRYAAEHKLVLLTKNPRDFAELHSTSPAHAGILVIYQDNDPQRDMTYAEIVHAIANLESAGIKHASDPQCLAVLSRSRFRPQGPPAAGTGCTAWWEQNLSAFGRLMRMGSRRRPLCRLAPAPASRAGASDPGPTRSDPCRPARLQRREPASRRRARESALIIHLQSARRAWEQAHNDA